MVATTVKSTNATNIEASPATTLDRKVYGRSEIVILDKIAVATTSIDETGDAIMFGPIPSNAVITDVEIMNDDLDSNGTPALAVNVGLYYTGIGGNQVLDGNTSGTVIDADCFASAATTLQAATTTWQSLRFEADDIVDVTKEAWDVGALSADPGGLLYVGVAVTTAAATAAAGDVVMKITLLA